MLRKKELLERGVYYIADFVYYRDGEYVVEDTKGVRTKEYIIKRKAHALRSWNQNKGGIKWRRKQHRYKKAIAGRVGMAEKRRILFVIAPSLKWGGP